MLLAAGLLIEFAKFLKIMSWIVLPVFLSVVVITILVHYRRKKKQKNIDADPIHELLLPSAVNEGQPDKEGAYVLFDHSGLIRQYQNKLSYNHARYAALKHDFEKLEMKYNAALHPGKSRLTHPKNKTMENTTETLLAEIGQLKEEYGAEKKEVLLKVEQLGKSYKNLEEENESLLQQVSMLTAGDEERGAIINRWKEENTALKMQVKEQQYLRDLVEEKKAQVEFLQNQLEQRVKSYHQAEQTREETDTQLEQMKMRQQQAADELSHIQTELGYKQELITAKENQLEEKQQTLLSKLDHITYLENVLNELRTQNEMLNAEVADHQQRASVLQQQIEDEQSRAESAEHRLMTNKQMLQRLYKEFSACMEEEDKSSPIVTLHPAYINKEEWNETAVQ